MDRIIIKDLEVFYHVGVPDEERAHAQRLLLTVEMEYDFTASAGSDDLTQTINYFAVSQKLLSFGVGRSWKLLEKLSVDIADTVLKDFGATAVSVKVKKFIIPQTQYVAVQIRRSAK